MSEVESHKAAYQAWSKNRTELYEREETDDPPRPGEWHDSDDRATFLLEYIGGALGWDDEEEVQPQEEGHDEIGRQVRADELVKNQYVWSTLSKRWVLALRIEMDWRVIVVHGGGRIVFQPDDKVMVGTFAEVKNAGGEFA